MSSLDTSSELPASSEMSMPDFHEVRKASLIFRALNHKLRQQMLLILLERKELTVSELFHLLKLEQSVASQHLAILRRAGLVKKERDGKFMYYKLNLEKLQLLNKMITELLK